MYIYIYIYYIPSKSNGVWQKTALTKVNTLAIPQPTPSSACLKMDHHGFIRLGPFRPDAGAQNKGNHFQKDVWLNDYSHLFFSGTIQQLQSEFWILGSKNGWIIFSPRTNSRLAEMRVIWRATRWSRRKQWYHQMAPACSTNTSAWWVSQGHPEYRDEWWWIAIKNYWTNLKYMDMD